MMFTFPCGMVMVCGVIAGELPYRCMEAWSGFVEIETAEQNIEAARGIFRRCYTHVLEGGGQVRSFCMLGRHACNTLPRNLHCADCSQAAHGSAANEE